MSKNIQTVQEVQEDPIRSSISLLKIIGHTLDRPLDTVYRYRVSVYIQSYHTVCREDTVCLKISRQSRRTQSDVDIDGEGHCSTVET